ncbi:MAG TPA: hypothetical protein DDW23_03555 [Planctomycetes bacterium]|nr:hypothetical protein [Planctomycetota bacterium]
MNHVRITLAVFCLASFLGGFLSSLDAESVRRVEESTAPLQVFPMGMMDSVRRTSGAVPMQVQVYNSGSEVHALNRIRVLGPTGSVILNRDLQGENLPGDRGFYERLLFDLETINPEISHRHNPRIFISEEERPELGPDLEAELIWSIHERVDALRQGGAVQVRNLNLSINLADVFTPESVPGAEALLDVIVDSTQNDGTTSTAILSHKILLLADYALPPREWVLAHGSSSATWVTGDLHVHNCRDQASGGCPDCNAESFNISGSFTNAQLKPQFQALGMDFFSTTTHSYCINSDTEFDAVASEAISLDEVDFQVLCGTELTCVETGSQSGSDIFDGVCLLGGYFNRGISHYGGHGISSRKPGGGDGLFNNCDDPIYDQATNVNSVNSEGGFAVANHPGGGGIWGGGLGLNSVAKFRGIESGKAWGSEIWNGSGATASGTHRNWWISRLKSGRVTFPFSGSDTHDSAFDFGANHTLVEGSLSDASLVAALKSGRTYLSNGPFLDIELSDNAGHSLGMGGIAFVRRNSIPSNHPVSLTAFYNMGAGTGKIRFYRGHIGGDEVLLDEIPGVTGSGSLSASDVVSRTNHSWYRVEIILDNSQGAAYSTPLFIALQ